MQNSGNKYAAYKKWLPLIILLATGCQLIQTTPLPTEIQAQVAVAGMTTPVTVVIQAVEASTVEPATPTPETTPTPTLTPTPVATSYFLEGFTMKMDSGDDDRDSRASKRHGLIIAFILPVLVFGIPWLIFEFFTVRYVQPQGIDLSTIRIKAQDGLFIETTLSMTARRSLGLASARMTWSTVRDFMEKTVEQELIHEALNFPTLDELERNLKNVTEGFLELPVIKELYRDFGVEVLRFNVETRYPQETMDALNRKAEASAGGAAYLAYAASAHLDPDTPESRKLYEIFQETSGRVDAARNLGVGIASLARVLSRDRDEEEDGSRD